MMQTTQKFVVWEFAIWFWKYPFQFFTILGFSVISHLTKRGHVVLNYLWPLLSFTATPLLLEYRNYLHYFLYLTNNSLKEADTCVLLCKDDD